MVLQLVAEERARDVDLLATNDGDLLAGEDLLLEGVEWVVVDGVWCGQGVRIICRDTL